MIPDKEAHLCHLWHVQGKGQSLLPHWIKPFKNKQQFFSNMLMSPTGCDTVITLSDILNIHMLVYVMATERIPTGTKTSAAQPESHEFPRTPTVVIHHTRLLFTAVHWKTNDLHLHKRVNDLRGQAEWWQRHRL